MQSPEFIEYILHGDVVEIKGAIKTLNESKDSEELKKALELLEFYMESIDHANNLVKLNGLVPVLNTMKNEDPEVALMAAWVIGTCAQNNPEFQSVLYNNGGIPALAEHLKETSNTKFINKLIYAISGSIRDHKEATEEFKKESGFDRCISLLKESDDEGLRKKIAFMLSYVGRDNQFLRDQISKENVYDSMCELLELDKSSNIFE